MTSLAITEGWTMTPGIDHKNHRGWGAWREVAVAWALAAVLVSALMLVPNHGTERPPVGLWSLAPAAGGHVHPQTLDPEGPASEEACSDRDYANELC